MILYFLSLIFAVTAMGALLYNPKEKSLTPYKELKLDIIRYLIVLFSLIIDSIILHPIEEQRLLFVYICITAFFLTFKLIYMSIRAVKLNISIRTNVR